MITLKTTGSFDFIESGLKKIKDNKKRFSLNEFGVLGVRKLSEATPVDTGETKRSWTYKVTDEPNGQKISWFNNHVDDGEPVVLLIQYGHGTGTGGYVPGQDFINPAIAQVFDELRREINERMLR